MKTEKILKNGRWVLSLLGLACVAAFVVALRSLPAETTAEPPTARTFNWPEPVTPDPESWGAIERTGTARRESSGPLSQRYRLAGTFFAYGAAHSDLARRAIIDDLETKDQKLVRENDEIGDVKVVDIFQDHVVLRAEGREEELWLSFAGQGEEPAQVVLPSATEKKEIVLGTTTFGRRVGESRWVLHREKLMGYYRELLDDPERLAAIYLSLKPDRNNKRKIKGYYLETEGEGDFFKSMGLREGDVIRKVNSMQMTSQRRAEYFLGEFVKNRLSAVVLDIERDKKAEQLIFMIR